MDKFLLLIVSMFLLYSCHTPDVSSIKKGISSQLVIEKIGKPKVKREIQKGVEWWYYGNQQVVVIKNGLVAKVIDNIKIETDSLNAADKRRSTNINSENIKEDH